MAGRSWPSLTSNVLEHQWIDVHQLRLDRKRRRRASVLMRPPYCLVIPHHALAVETQRDESRQVQSTLCSVSCCNPSILRWLSVSRWREEALRLKATEAGSATRMPMWAAFGSHHHPVDLIDFEPYTEITTRPTGPREGADAPPFVTPELRAAHRVGAPVRRRGRVHHPPYDAARN